MRSNKKIIFLACFERYVLPLLVAFLIPFVYASGMRKTLLFIGISFFIMGICYILGAYFKWTHTYCALQSYARRKVTPDKINWDEFTFSDKYGAPIVFLIISAVSFALIIFKII